MTYDNRRQNALSSDCSRSMVLVADPEWSGSSLTCVDRGALGTRLAPVYIAANNARMGNGMVTKTLVCGQILLAMVCRVHIIVFTV